MDLLKEMMITVMTVTIAAGAVKLLSPDGKGSIKAQINLAVSLSVCAVLIFSLAGKLKKSDFSLKINIPASVSEISEQNAENEVIECASEILCRELERKVSEKFGISSPEITVELDKNDISSVKILSAEISGEGEIDIAKKYISELLECPVTAKEIQ